MSLEPDDLPRSVRLGVYDQIMLLCYFPWNPFSVHIYFFFYKDFNRWQNNALKSILIYFPFLVIYFLLPCSP